MVFLPEASACTAIYAESGQKEGGSTIFARLEEIDFDERRQKLFGSAAIGEGMELAGITPGTLLRLQPI